MTMSNTSLFPDKSDLQCTESPISAVKFLLSWWHFQNINFLEIHWIPLSHYFTCAEDVWILLIGYNKFIYSFNIWRIARQMSNWSNSTQIPGIFLIHSELFSAHSARAHMQELGNVNLVDSSNSNPTQKAETTGKMDTKQRIFLWS